MLRTSLRSVSDPFHERVCFSCLAQTRLGGRNGLRYYSTPIRYIKGSSKKPDPSKKNEKKHPTASIKPQKKSPAPLSKKPQEAKKTPAQKEESPAPKMATKGDSTSRIRSSLEAIVSSAAASSKPTSKSTPKKSVPENEWVNSARPKDAGQVTPNKLHLKPLDVETAPVPQLSFGLERVLFNPGVYNLRDPRSRVYNFDPYLGSIMPVTEFDFAALKEYITSSKDDTLRNIAVKEKKKYVGSSSSMTSVLSHFHYLLSAWRGVDTQTISQGFPDKLKTFTRLLRSPSAMFLRYQDGTYAIDADKEFDSANILMNLGKSMEKLLTLPKEDFERYRRTSDNKITQEEEQAIPESYHYSTIGDFVMRSQLDAYDPRLPGTGMFDLKTRAVVSIRMDARNFEHGLGYEIKQQYGAFESYEREFYDMIRAAFLKYSLQVRIGRMDGIFVAFHNIERIFGFQYVSLPEMDQTLHGQNDTTLGDQEFKSSLELWNKVLDKVTAKFPKRSIRLHFEARDATTPFMYIFAEPVTEDEIHAIQTKNQEAVDAYQRRILNLGPHDGEETSKPSDEVAPVSKTGTETKEASDQVDDAKKFNEKTPRSTYDSSEPLDESFLSDLQKGAENLDQNNDRELYAMTLTVRNRVNGKITTRPENITSADTWTVDYELSEIPDDRAGLLYQACQVRREKALSFRGEDEMDVAGNAYIRKLREISAKGRDFRKQENEQDKKSGVVVLPGSE